METDYLIVGSGLTGSTIARLLADDGQKVIVVERRSHIGGNCYDHMVDGIRVHDYGPHTFRTNNPIVWDFVNRFDQFYKYELIVNTIVDGKYVNWPVLGSYLKSHYKDWKKEVKAVAKPKNFEEASLSMMPRGIYTKFVKHYTEKQWGVPAKRLSADLAKRFDVREDDDPRLKKETYQGLPKHGYSTMFENMLKGIIVILGYDHLLHRREITVKKKIIYTGPIDEYFNYKLGKLKYRGQKRVPSRQKLEYGRGYWQPAAVVNYPDPSDPSIRTIEWKHMMPETERPKDTQLTIEYPYTPTNPNDYEYPFPDEKNRLLYEKYAEYARQHSRVHFCGRLGDYKYYDMDVAIEQAMAVYEALQ